MTNFKEYFPDQTMLLPLNLKDWLPENHLANFVSDVVDCLNLTKIYNSYSSDKGGQPPYHPKMMTKLIMYAYCIGNPSSRKIEKKTYEDVAFRVLAAGAYPDHDTIAAFRRRHLAELAELFIETVKLCQKAGLVKLGHVALDGTKVKANASKHKAMSYKRMCAKERELQEKVEEILNEAERVDAEEDLKYGKGKRGDELPADLSFHESRLKKIREAKAALEEEAKKAVEAKKKERREKEEEAARDGKMMRGRKPKEPDNTPPAKAQRNFTDPESRIMKDGATKAFVQAYNAQVAVEAGSQVIVAADVTQEVNDKQQFIPIVEQIKQNTGRLPKEASADAGYFSEENVTASKETGIDPYISPERRKHSEKPVRVRGRCPQNMTVKDRMKRKLLTKRGREIYSLRKETVEPVIGQIKEVRGFRRFLFRGRGLVKNEWRLICATHNLLKLYRSGWSIMQNCAASCPITAPP